jgi:hypothetical protein
LKFSYQNSVRTSCFPSVQAPLNAWSCVLTSRCGLQN